MKGRPIGVCLKEGLGAGSACIIGDQCNSGNCFKGRCGS